MVRRIAALLDACIIVLATTGAATAAPPGPQNLVRQFCQADGVGQRVRVQTWSTIAPLVGWEFEPAWDSVVLIGGYEVGTPQPAESGKVQVPVRYTVVGQVSALGIDDSERIEPVVFTLEPTPESGWHIVGPPPQPHVFRTEVYPEAMRQSLESAGPGFVTDSMFVWQLLRSAGWDLPFESIAELSTGPAYTPVDDARSGDVVVFLRDGAPYHAGIIDADGGVVSSTLNAGIVHTSIHAFAGEVRYLRMHNPAPLESADVVPDTSTTPAVRRWTPAARKPPHAPTRRPPASARVTPPRHPRRTPPALATPARQ